MDHLTSGNAEQFAATTTSPNPVRDLARLTTEHINQCLKSITETVALVRAGRLEPLPNSTLAEDLEIQESARQAFLNELHGRALIMNDQLDERRQLAESVMRTHKAIAFNSDAKVTGGTIYEHSQALLLAVIAAAYPELEPHSVYSTWCDCQESIEYCARYTRDELCTLATEALNYLYDIAESESVRRELGSERSAAEIQAEARVAILAATQSRENATMFRINHRTISPAACVLLARLDIVEGYVLTRTGQTVRRIMIQNGVR